MSADARPAPSPKGAPGLAFRPSRLRWPEWVVGISALVLLILLLGPSWYTVPNPAAGSGVGLGSSELSLDGWDGLSHAHWLLLVTIIAAFVLFLLQATRRSPAWPVTFSWLVLVLGLLSTLWLLIRVPIKPPGSAQAAAWLALVTAAVLTLAALRSLSMEGIAEDDAPEVRTVTRSELAAERSAHRAVASEPAPGATEPTS
jgi:hypothetical protein